MSCIASRTREVNKPFIRIPGFTTLLATTEIHLKLLRKVKGTRKKGEEVTDKLFEVLSYLFAYFVPKYLHAGGEGAGGGSKPWGMSELTFISIKRQKSLLVLNRDNVKNVIVFFLPFLIF